jgi:hypothetical protein
MYDGDPRVVLLDDTTALVRTDDGEVTVLHDCGSR